MLVLFKIYGICVGNQMLYFRVYIALYTFWRDSLMSFEKHIDNHFDSITYHWYSILFLSEVQIKSLVCDEWNVQP